MGDGADDLYDRMAVDYDDGDRYDPYSGEMRNLFDAPPLGFLAPYPSGGEGDMIRLESTNDPTIARNVTVADAQALFDREGSYRERHKRVMRLSYPEGCCNVLNAWAEDGTHLGAIGFDNGLTVDGQHRCPLMLTIVG